MARLANTLTGSARIAAAACALIAIAFVVAPGVSGARAEQRACKDVVVRFEPEGSGGATKIKVKRIKCAPARKILRRCIGGELTSGWSGTYSNGRFHLKLKRKRISYLPVGGGGCIPVRGSHAR